MPGITTTAKLVSVGAGGLVGAGLWAATGQSKNVKDATDAFAWSAATAVASVGAFALMKGGRDRILGPNSATFAMMGMGLGAAAAYAVLGASKLGDPAKS